MFRSFRQAARFWVIEAVKDATAAELTGVRSDLRALRRDVRGLSERLDDVERALRQHMQAWERRTRRDVLTAVDQEAMRTSAAFLLSDMGDAQPYFQKTDTLHAALSAAPREGLFLEFGVASGSTLRLIVEGAPAGTVFGFDSFKGLPEDWRPGFSAGMFEAQELPDVPGAELVVGWFDDTLPGFLADHQDEVAFLHLDADLYSSTRTVLQALRPRLRKGTVILFDEYFNFPGWEAHEHRAWTEFVSETGLEFEYLGYTADDEQLAVRLVTAPDPATDATGGALTGAGDRVVQPSSSL